MPLSYKAHPSRTVYNLPLQEFVDRMQRCAGITPEAVDDLVRTIERLSLPDNRASGDQLCLLVNQTFIRGELMSSSVKVGRRRDPFSGHHLVLPIPPASNGADIIQILNTDAVQMIASIRMSFIVFDILTECGYARTSTPVRKIMKSIDATAVEFLNRLTGSFQGAELDGLAQPSKVRAH